MLGFLEKSEIVVMLISGLEMYAAIYIDFGNTPKIQAIMEKVVGVEREEEIEKQREREDKVPNMPQMFLQTISSTGNWKKKWLHFVL